MIFEPQKPVEFEERCQFCFAMPGEAHHPLCPNVNENYCESWQALPPGTLLQNGAYQIGFCFPPGGCGITYLGWEFGIDRVVAIKECYPAQNVLREHGTWNVIPRENHQRVFEEMVNRLKHEAHIQHLMTGSPYTANVHAIFPANNTLYFVMDFIGGKSLENFIRENGTLTWNEALDLVAFPILDALEDVHEHQIMHLDIAPDNIYITDDRKLRLLDFGAAQFPEEANSNQKLKLIKRGYAPSEQYRKNEEDVLGFYTDIYSVGAVLYFVLMGKVPPDALLRLKDNSIDIGRDLESYVPDPYRDVLLKALADDPKKRFRTVREFRDALKKADFSVKQNEAVSEGNADRAAEISAFVENPVKFENVQADHPDSKPVSTGSSHLLLRKLIFTAIVCLTVFGTAMGIWKHASDQIKQERILTEVQQQDPEEDISAVSVDVVYYCPAYDTEFSDRYGELAGFLKTDTVFSVEKDCPPVSGKTCIMIKSDPDPNRAVIVGKTGYIDDMVFSAAAAVTE